MSHTKQSLPTGSANENTITETGDANRVLFRPVQYASMQNQFRALFGKHFNYCRRRWKFHIIQLLVPFILMTMCFYCVKDSVKSEDQPLKLDISSVYGSTDGFYYLHGQNVYNLKEIYRNLLESNDVSMESVSEPTHYVLNYGNKDLAKYVKKLIVGGTFDSFPSGTWNLTAWYNLGSHHSMPMSLLLMQTALLRFVANTGSISLAIEPIVPVRDKYKALAITGPNNIWAQFFVPLAFTFLSISFILKPMHEKTTKAKLLQLMSGVPAAVYWIFFFLWDYFIYFVICSFLIATPAFFFPTVYFGTHLEAAGSFLLLLFLYGWASLPLGYIVSILLKRESRGFTIFIGFCILFSVISLVLILSLTMFLFMKDGIRRNLSSVRNAEWFFRIFPLYSISKGVLLNSAFALINAACDIFPPDELWCHSSRTSAPTLLACCKGITDGCDSSGESSLFNNCHKKMKHLSMKTSANDISYGPEALLLGLEGIIFFAILFLLETRTAHRFLNILEFHFQRLSEQINRAVLRRGRSVMRYQNTMDNPPVLQGQEMIQNLTATQQGADGQVLVVSGLGEKSGNLSPVNRLTFNVNREEHFGILGVNGAGKTSLFRMLTSDGLPTEGNAFIHGSALMGDFRKFQSHIGYCPDVDSTMDELTGRETLYLFGQLRNLQGHELHKNVIDLIQSMGLANCADELTQFYSVGNKRKLSVAVALVGSPPVILLDEPTARAGPESRRQIWETLTRVQKRTGAAVLLATQSIEESEALCNRVAVMVDGHFRCLGPVEELKSKQGQGYVLTIKMSKGQQLSVETVDALKNHVQNGLKSATLTDDYQGLLQFQVSDPSMTIGSLFKFMSDVKAQFELEDYSIGANSLEQTFLACNRA